MVFLGCLRAKVFAQLKVQRTERSDHSLKWWFLSLQIQLKSFLVEQVSRKRKDIIVIHNVIVAVVSVVAWVHAVSFF